MSNQRDSILGGTSESVRNIALSLVAEAIAGGVKPKRLRKIIARMDRAAGIFATAATVRDLKGKPVVALHHARPQSEGSYRMEMACREAASLLLPLSLALEKIADNGGLL